MDEARGSAALTMTPATEPPKSSRVAEVNPDVHSNPSPHTLHLPSASKFPSSHTQSALNAAPKNAVRIPIGHSSHSVEGS